MACACIRCLAESFPIWGPLVKQLDSKWSRLRRPPPLRTGLNPVLNALALPELANLGAPGPIMIGDYLVSIVFLPTPLDVIRKILPPRLKPAPQSLTPKGTHPLMMMYGYQSDVRPPWYPFAGMEYLEIIAAVPYVKWANADPGDKRCFVHMPRLYLNQLLPTVLGWICGYAKRLGHFHVSARDYDVYTRNQRQLLAHGEWTPVGRVGAPDDFKNFKYVKDVFLQTIIGKRGANSYPCTKINFDLANARMQAIQAEGEITDFYLNGLPGTTFRVPGIDSSPLGAFRLHTRWELLPPFDCSTYPSVCKC